MKIAIISDVHNNLTTLQKVLDYCAQNGIENIISCGDLASLETLDFLNDHFEGQIFHVLGNMDRGHLKDQDFPDIYRKTRMFPEFGEAEFDGKQVAFVHFPDVAKELARTGKYLHVFYGHTHAPWEEKVDGHHLLNPGNVAGERYQPTFAVWNTENDQFELIRVHQLK